MTRRQYLGLAICICLGLASTTAPGVVYCQGTTAPGCPTALTTHKGLVANTTVKYDFAGLTGVNGVSDGTIRDLARTAFDIWTALNTTNDSKIVFKPREEGDTEDDITIRFAVAAAHIPNPYDPTMDVKAVTSYQELTSDNHVKKALITIDLNNKGTVTPQQCAAANTTAALPCQFFLPTGPNYNDHVINIFLHEILHVMGIGDVPTATQKPGVSIMSGAYSPNDCVKYAIDAPCLSAHPPLPQPCDITAINDKFAPPPPPPPSGGGGGTGSGGTGGGNPTPPPPPPLWDWDGDTYIEDDCDPYEERIHPNQPHWEKCDNFLALGGEVDDVDCDTESDRDECYSVEYGFHLLGMDAPIPQVHLVTFGGRFVSAESNGGGSVNALPTSGGAWETFGLVDFNGGWINDGDLVAFVSSSGWFLQAADGGGGAMNAGSQSPGTWVRFYILNLDRPGEPINQDDRIALLGTGGYYVCAEGGGADVVNVNRSAIAEWETFRLRYSIH